MQQQVADYTAESSVDQSKVVNDLILQRFRLRAKKRIAWLRNVWQNKIPNNKELAGYQQEIDLIISNADSPESEQLWYAETDPIHEIDEELIQVENTLDEDKHSRLFLLRTIFGLNKQEEDQLQACLSLCLDPALERICAYLNNQLTRSYITNELSNRLYGNGKYLPLSPESPLIIWKLLEKKEIHIGEPEKYTISPFLYNWLSGVSDLDEKLVAYSHLIPAEEPLPNWPVNAASEFLKENLSINPTGRIRLIIEGAQGIGRKTFAACVARKLNMPVLAIKTDGLSNEQWKELCVHVFRHAYIDGCAIAWTGEDIGERIFPTHLLPFQIQFVICRQEQEISTVPGVADKRITIPELSLEETGEHWQNIIVRNAKGWKKSDFKRILRKYHFNIGQIYDMASLTIKSTDDIEQYIELQARKQLGSLAQPMATTFTWDDLVINEVIKNQLKDFIYEASENRNIWERPEMTRLFPQGKGLFALFTGSSGTGKTMAAQVVAAMLNLPLFRIDLSSVVSKYVGETSKNLERILSQARNMNAVLLFDEADALFGKRTEIKDAHDRFANTDTNYLLQAIEEFPGIAILTSNKKTNIDTGFVRRLRYVLDFPKPNSKQRVKIWNLLIGELAGKESLVQLESSVETLAENIELTGAQIKLSVLSALIMAQRENCTLELEHLLKGIEREWMKEGRGISGELRQVLCKKTVNNKPVMMHQ